MHAKIRREKGTTILEGDAAFFAWLHMAANSASNGLQGNAVECVGGRLELVTTQPAPRAVQESRTATRPAPPPVEGRR